MFSVLCIKYLLSMKQENMQFSLVNVEELMSMLDEKITSAFEKLQGKSQNVLPEKDFYTRKEVSELLNISYSSLFNWNRDGILLSRKIGNRVYYLKSDVISKLSQNA